MKRGTKAACSAALVAVMLAACLSGCGTEVKAKGQMIGGVSMGRGL